MQNNKVKSAGGKAGRAHWLRARPYAHRGLHAHPIIAENSLPALRLAVEYGFGCAIDVRVLHDGTPVLFHDEDAARMTGVAGAIEDRCLAEISQLRLRRAGEKIPTLAQALKTIDGRTPLIIDFKSQTQAPNCVSAVCDQLRDYPGEFAVLSSSGRHLAWLARHAPDIIRGQTFAYDPAVAPPGIMAMAPQLHAAIRHARLDFIALDLQTLSVVRAWLIKARIPLFVWTVTNLAQWRWAECHASNFMFELSAQMPLATITDRSTIGNATACQPSSLRHSNTPPPRSVIYSLDNSAT